MRTTLSSRQQKVELDGGQVKVWGRTQVKRWDGRGAKQLIHVFIGSRQQHCVMAQHPTNAFRLRLSASVNSHQVERGRSKQRPHNPSPLCTSRSGRGRDLRETRE